MKIECVKEKLLHAVSKIERIATKNAALPILSCLLFEVKNNNLKIKATNMDIGVEAIIPVKVTEEGVVAVLGSVFVNLISNIQNEKSVILETIDSNLQIKTDYGKTVIKSHPSDDFPTIPKVSDDLLSFDLDSKKLIKGLKSVIFSSSLSNVKPELSSVYIYTNEDNVFFAAADSFRLAEKKINLKHNNNFFNVLIPAKNIPDIIRIFEDVDGDINIHLSKNQISFSYGYNYLVSRVVDGIFPDYKQLIPNEFKTEVVVLKQDLLSALKISNIFTDKFNKISLKIEPSNKVFEMMTKNSDIGESTNIISAGLSGEDVLINFNYKYIVDCLPLIDSDSISLSFNGVSKPLVIRGGSDKSFTYIVMPMNK
ncbi:MAG: DNA polymerase III subunit beta [Patescibacteria group bacterium]|nr:DNA polymerase III subunit beta [Patescibacteria group bacterium]MDE1988175.1 DNA polymerase III subunit beta [Patescibacteria group bacterium]MDE2218027.1 DNA polymerase III subunit beta [Patescibacteria group bacterium]